MTDPVRATATGTAGSGSFLLLRHQFCLGERCMHTQMSHTIILTFWA